MSAPAVLRRLAAMDRNELRFRLVCEARKTAGRLRCAIDPPRLRHADLARILDPAAGPLIAQASRSAQRGDSLDAHRALSRHFAARQSRWPLQAASRASLAEEVRQAFPGAARDAARRADRILAGRHDLLGYRDVPLGDTPDWHADAIHKRRTPRVHWAAVPFLDPAFGDHKIIWEPNRHQYWLTLGVAFWLTGDPRYRAAFIAHLGSWLRENPPLIGVNWASMLELAFRTMSWTWAVEFFAAGGEEDDTPWLVDLLLSMDRQLTHVAHNLSRYFSPNTHLSGEALALYAVSTALPELRRSEARITEGRTVLLGEIDRQVLPDGGHVELSAHYHRYTTDFYLLALMVARSAGDTAAAAFENASHRLAAYLRTMADDRGILPLIGDDDGGQLFRFSGRVRADASPTLGVAATLLADGSLAVAQASDDVYWILGRRPAGVAPHDAPSPWPSRVLRESGYLVSRTPEGGHLVFDAGPHGFLNGGHAHADALSLALSVGGEPVFVDPGTASYSDPVLRDRFRSSHMHNTLTIDGRDHAEPKGPFHWRSQADARFLVARTAPGLDFAVGSHDGYRSARHMRAVVAIHGTGWLVVDRIVSGGRLVADTWWHLHPAWRAAIRDGAVTLTNAAGRRLAFASTAEELALLDEPDVATFAPEYGRIERSTTIRATRSGTGPFHIAAFVPASAALSEPIAIVETRERPAFAPEALRRVRRSFRGGGSGDHGVPASERAGGSGGAKPPGEEEETAAWAFGAFQIQAGGVELRVTVAFPTDIKAQPDATSWPQPCIEQLVRTCAE
jgi:uncharacterized heparinase superfamily protein